MEEVVSSNLTRSTKTHRLTPQSPTRHRKRLHLIRRPANARPEKGRPAIIEEEARRQAPGFPACRPEPALSTGIRRYSEVEKVARVAQFICLYPENRHHSALTIQT